MILLFIFNLVFTVYCEQINTQSISIPRQNMASASLSNLGIGLFAGGYAIETKNPPIFETIIANIYDRVDIYRVSTNKWTTASLSVARFDACAVPLPNQGLILIAGGKTSLNTYSAVIDIYNANSNSWSLNTLGTARAGMMCTSLPSKGLAFFAGGVNSQADDLKIVNIFNFVTNTATTVNLQEGRSYGGATFDDNLGVVFFAGGFKHPGITSIYSFDKSMVNYVLSDAFEIYNANTNTWTKLTLPTARGTPLVTSILNPPSVLISFGKQYSYSNSIDIYDINRNRWSNSNMNGERYFGAVANWRNLNFVMFFGSYQSVDFYAPDNSYFYERSFEIFGLYKIIRSFNSINILNMSSITFENPNIIIVAGGDQSSFNSGSQYRYSVNSTSIYAQCNGGILSINPTSCSVCPAGYFCPYLLEPAICPKGSYCPQGNNFPVNCPSGTYNKNTGSTTINECNLCPAGTFSPSQGEYAIERCQKCSIGFYCPAGSSIFQPCPSQFYCPDSTQKIACPAGTFYDGTSATSLTSCKPCTNGNFCPGGGVGALSCFPGTFSSNVGGKFCDICPEGHACVFSTINPQKCPRNTIAAKGSADCTPCQAGEFTEEEGATTCKPCSGGKFDIKGWWCMTYIEKIVFVFIWVGSIASGGATLWKVYSTIKDKYEMLKKNNIEISIYNFIFTEKVIEEKTNRIQIMSKFLNANKPEKIIKEVELSVVNVDKMKTEIDKPKVESFNNFIDTVNYQERRRSISRPVLTKQNVEKQNTLTEATNNPEKRIPISIPNPVRQNVERSSNLTESVTNHEKRIPISRPNPVRQSVESDEYSSTQRIGGMQIQSNRPTNNNQGRINQMNRKSILRMT